LKHVATHPRDLAPSETVLSLLAKDAATALATVLPGGALAAALDRYYGKGKWFVCWDEDLRGKPIAGTISLAYGKNESLTIG
jgi:hypothetical protein